MYTCEVSNFLYVVLIGGIRKYLLAFSVHANGSRILSVDSAPADGSTLPALHGIRFLSMSWVILGHTWFFSIYVCSKSFCLHFHFKNNVLTNIGNDSIYLLRYKCLYYRFAVEIEANWFIQTFINTVCRFIHFLVWGDTKFEVRIELLMVIRLYHWL